MEALLDTYLCNALTRILRSLVDLQCTYQLQSHFIPLALELLIFKTSKASHIRVDFLELLITRLIPRCWGI